jgi:hypothetical protein
MKISIEVLDDYAEVLGEYRMSAISIAVAHHATAQMHASYILAVSGAMRWPAPMRPEAAVVGICDFI